MKQFFICVERNLMLECSNIVAAIFFCIGAHYIFNLNYHPKSGTIIIGIGLGDLVNMWYFFTGDVWIFIQEKVLGIPSKSGMKRHPSSVSHFSGISRVYESLNPASEDWTYGQLFSIMSLYYIYVTYGCVILNIFFVIAKILLNRKGTDRMTNIILS